MSSGEHHSVACVRHRHRFPNAGALRLANCDGPTMNRHDILMEADRLTQGARNEAHGDPLPNHQRIAAVFSVILGIEVTATQAALCMAGMKLARLAYNPTNTDSAIDLAAYAGIAGELAEREAACVSSGSSSPASTPATGNSSPSSSTTEPGMLTTLPGHSEACCRTFPAETY